ncbi:MAG: hypothetical protein J5720_08480 [Bacteroidaceae bacterium]|nr:hypothetical protein [Bacteroidaceae bacterium]
MFGRLFHKEKQLTGLGFLMYEVREILDLNLEDLKLFSDNYNPVSMLNLLVTCKNHSCQQCLLKQFIASEFKFGTGAETAPYEKKVWGMVSRRNAYFYSKWEEEIRKGQFPLINSKDNNLWNERQKMQQEIEDLKTANSQYKSEKQKAEAECAHMQHDIETLQYKIEEIKTKFAESVPLDFFTKNVTYDSIIQYTASRQDTSAIDVLTGMLEALLPKEMHEKIRTDVSSRLSQNTTFNNYGTYVAEGGTQVNYLKK